MPMNMGCINKSKCFGLLCMLIFLNACMQQPKSVAQVNELAVPEHWSLHAPAVNWPSQQWWKAFQSAQLNQLVVQAQTQNLTLAAAVARVEQAQAQLGISQAEAHPQVDASISAGRQDNDNQRSNFFNLGLGAAYEVDFWGRQRALRSAADWQLQASRFDQQTLGLSVTAQVVAGYFTLCALQQRVQIAEQNQAIAARILKIVDARVQYGAALRIDQAQQRLQLASLQQQTAQLKQQKQEALVALTVLLGLAPSQLQVSAEPLEKMVLPVVQPGLPAEVLQRRPDIANLEAQLQAAEANLQAARAALFPSLQLTAEVNRQSSALSSWLSGNSGFSIGASLLQTIFDRKGLYSARDLQAARQRELTQNYQAGVLVALQEVDNGLTRTRSLQQQAQLQQQQLQQAQLALNLAEVAYKAGTSDLLSTLDAQRSFYQLQDSSQQLLLAQLQAAVDLNQALGGGFN